MWRALPPQREVGQVAAACRMRTERPTAGQHRRLTAADYELRRLTKLMVQQVEQRCRDPKRSNMFTGSISQLTHRDLNTNRTTTQHAMLNNHGLDSLELDNSRDDVISCTEDRCDGDSQSGSDVAAMSTNNASLTQIRQQQSSSHSELRQQQNHLIIPKRLHLVKPTESYSPSTTPERSISQSGQAPNLSSSLGSYDSTIDEGNRCNDSLSEDASSDNSQELIFQPTTPRRLPPAPLPSLVKPDQSVDETMEIWESDRNRSQSPYHVPGDCALMAVHPKSAHCEDESGNNGHQSKRIAGMELFQVSDADVSAQLLNQQLRLIDQSSRRKCDCRLKSLCTSSSNCCGGRRNKAESDASMDSSINLVNGARILCRPGSLPGINIEGLATCKMPCSHYYKVREKQHQPKPLPPKRNVCLVRKRGNKRVSFSTCAQCVEKSEVQTKEVTTDTEEGSRTSKKEVTLEIGMSSDATQQIGTDSSEYLAFKRASQKGVKLDATPSVGEGVAAEPQRRQIPPQPQPPPVPPHATKRLGHRNIHNRSATAKILNATCSFENDSSFELESGRPLSTNHSKHNDCLLSTDTDSNINIALGHQFTNTDPNWRRNRSEFGTSRTTDVTVKSKDHQDTLSMLSDQDFASDKATPDRAANALEFRAVTYLQAQTSQWREALSLPRDSNNQSSSEKGVQKGGSNCANSAVKRDGRNRIYRHHHHFPSTRMPPLTSQSTGGSSTTTALSVSPNRGDQRNAHQADSSSYVVFQHPPEVSRSANFHRSALEDRDGRGGSGKGLSDDSIAFSWVTRTDDIGRGQDKSLLKENSLTDSSTSSHRNSHAEKSGREDVTGKVLFNQINTVEGQIISIKATVTDSARVGDAAKDFCVRPSEVRDAAVSSVAKRVTRPPSSETVQTCDPSESDSSQPFLMLEAISCGHKDNETHGCSINCRSYSPGKAAAPTTAGPTAINGDFKAEQRLRIIAEKPPQAKPRSQPPPPPLQPLPPWHVPQPTSTAPPTPPAAAAAAAAATADAVRDLLTQVCDPAEAAAMTRALVRGLVGNVESLRSALVATLMLLKDRKSCTRPLAQAIGTANTLDDLIRQVQTSHRRLCLRRRQEPDRHHRHRATSGDEWWPAADRGSASTTPESEGDTAMEDEAEKEEVVVADVAGRAANDAAASSSHRRRRGKRYDADSWGRVASRRSERFDPASLSTQPCQAMAHYVISEQFLEPSLEQRCSLECRPVTTRLVRPESRVVNLARDTKLKRPVTQARRAKPQTLQQQAPVRNT